MDVEEEGDYNTYRYTVTTRTIPALRWAAMRAILMFQLDVMDKVTRQCPQTTTILKTLEKGEPKRYGTEVLPLTSLAPYRLAKPAHRVTVVLTVVFISNRYLQQTSPWCTSGEDTSSFDGAISPTATRL